MRCAGCGAVPGSPRSPSFPSGLASASIRRCSRLDSLLFRPLPVTAPDTLVDVSTTGGDGDEYATTSYQDFLDLKAQNTVFSAMLGSSPMMAPLNLGDRSRISLGQVVTSNHFTMLGVQPHLGRLLVPSDDDPGAARASSSHTAGGSESLAATRRSPASR